MNYAVFFFFVTVELTCLLVVGDDSPKNSLRTLPSLCELDDATKCVLPTLLKGLDMSILTRVLVSENMVGYSVVSSSNQTKRKNMYNN